MRPGGAALFAGANYQTAVATYLASVALAERAQQLDPAFPAGRPTRLGAEQGWPVDDLAVWFGNTLAWIQAKRTLTTSELRSALGQAVRQSRHGRGRAGESLPLGSDDRFVIAFDHADGRFADSIPAVLDRLRSAWTDAEIQQESSPARQALEQLRQGVLAAAPDASADEIRDVLGRLFIYRSTNENLGELSRAMLHEVVVDVAAGEAHLVQHFGQVAERRTLRDVTALRQLLRDRGVALRSEPLLRPDLERLGEITARGLAQERDRAIAAPDGSLHVDRAVTGRLLEMLAHGNTVVLGEAGAGKSVVLLDAAARLRTTGARVVLLRADDPLPQLEHALANVLTRWDQPGDPYLFIDAMDALRLPMQVRLLGRLIEELAGTPWRIAIASRDYDLANSGYLRRLFRRASVDEDDHVFGDVANVRVADLEDPELTDLCARSAAVAALFAGASEQLRALLRNPFNLSLAAELIGTDFREVRDRNGLLETWWNQRVAFGEPIAKEQQLRALVRRMMEERRLQVTSDALVAGSATEELLSASVLVRRGEVGETVGFRHAVIFDYAVERLLLTGEGATLAVLGADRDAFLFILPSLRSRFTRWFLDDPPRYWREVLRLFAAGTQRATLRLILASLPVGLIQDVDEAAPILNGGVNEAAALRFLVRAALRGHDRGETIATPDGGPWPDIALAAAAHLPTYEHDVALLVDACSKDTPTAAQRSALAAASRRLLERHLDRALDDPSLAWWARLVIPGFVRTFDADPVAAQPLLERLLTRERIERVGQFELQPLAYELTHLENPGALETIYAALFVDLALPKGTQLMGAPSVVLNLSSDNGQTLDLVRGELARRFERYLEQDPARATRSLCLAVGSTRWATQYVQTLRLRFRGEHRRFVGDHSQMWDTNVHKHDAWHIMATAFEARLRAEQEAGRPEVFWTAVREIVRHGPWLYLWRIIIRTASLNDLTARGTLPLIAQRKALLALELREPIETYLSDGYARLPQHQRARLDRAILALDKGWLRAARRRAFRQLIACYAAAIPAGITTALTSKKPNVPADPDDREMTLRGSITRAAAFGLERASEEAAEAGASVELQAAIDAVSSFLDPQASGDFAVMVPGVRRVVAALPPESEARQPALDVLAHVLCVGLKRELFTDGELAEFTPLLLEIVEIDVVPEDAETDNDHLFGGLFAPLRALPLLYRRTKDVRVAAALLAMAAHARAAVRRLALLSLGVLIGEYRAEVWALAERALDDPNFGVVDAASRLIEWLGHDDPHRAREGLLAAYDRFAHAPAKSDAKVDHVRRIVGWSFTGDADAAERIDRVIRDPWGHELVASTLAFVLACHLGPDDPNASQAASRLVPFVEGLTAHLRSINARASSDLSAGEREGVSISARVLNEIAQRMYFTAGTTQRSASGGLEDTGTIEVEHYRTLRPLFAAIATAPFGGSAYHLMKTLLGAIATDPDDVLDLGTTAILAGVRVGLAGDGQAQSDVQAFLMRYIVEYRRVLASDRALFSRLMDVVDAFAEVGWPQWLDVAFELDAIYRE